MSKVPALLQDEVSKVPLSKEELLNKIFYLEEQLAAMEQTPIPITHHFSDGLYAREMFAPAGTIMTGAVHKHGHFNFMLCGEVSVLTETGMHRIKGPCFIQSYPGIKRIGYVHKDVIWYTVHATVETDEDKLWETLVHNDKAQALLDVNKLDKLENK